MSVTGITKKGNKLEYLVASVFQGQGYLVRRAVPLKYGLSGQDATDIDVLGIKFTQPFQPHIILCDCKDKQRSKPYERIFWAKGLSSFVSASEAYVALPKSSIDIINFAKTGDVRILTQEVLDISYAQLYSDDINPFGMCNFKYYDPFYARVDSVLSKERYLNAILSNTRQSYLVSDPYVSLNIVLQNVSTLSKIIKKFEQFSDQYELCRFIIADNIVLSSLLLLYISSDTMGLSKSERAKHIKEKLTYGDISPKKASEIFKLAKEFAMEATLSMVPDASKQGLLPFDIGEIEAPPYAMDIIGLVERALGMPKLYHVLPLLLDQLLFEQSLQSHSFTEISAKKHFPDINDEYLKVARNIFSFFKGAAGLDLKLFWGKAENILPRIND